MSGQLCLWLAVLLCRLAVVAVAISVCCTSPVAVGGCDIITEMTMSGELDTLFESENISYDKDAASKIREANTE